MIDIEFAKLSPAEVFKSPLDVINNLTLTKKEKIEILRSWSYDERELQVAEEENMLAQGSRRVFLDDILKALLKLGVIRDLEEIPPTKHG